MFLSNLSLQNFRNYSKSEFNFNQNTTLIVGPNTSGKTNLLEAVFFLSTGKSFRGADQDVISFGKDIARIKTEGLETVFANQAGRFIKKYLVNEVAKHRINFVGHLPCVLFAPQDLELITSSPAIRRNYLDFILEQVDTNYRRSLLAYQKALRARNRLLENAQKVGRRRETLFDYWDDLIIGNGEIITKTRAAFVDFINSQSKDVFDFYIEYERNLISKERLLQYKEAELAAGVTLVGPQRDDFSINIFIDKNSTPREIKAFGSRGQQRLAVLQLKMIELKFLTEKLGEKPLLLLDDIFSELDAEHISLVLKMIKGQQTIITTTHKELVEDSFLKDASMLELNR